MTNVERKAFAVYGAITSLFDGESENYQFNLNQVDLTEFFTAMLIANNMFYRKVTEQEGDLLDFITVQTRLAFQYLNKKEGELNESTN